MARAGCRPNGLQKLEGDDVEKSLELLDKVLSEFEDPDSLPHIEPESPSQGNQSEDDGYMSMNGRRAKIPPDFHQQHLHQHENHQQDLHKEEPPTNELPHSPPVMDQPSALPVEIEETKSEEPPPPEVAEAIISNLLPRSGSTNTSDFNPHPLPNNNINITRINNPRHHLVRQHSQDIYEHNNSSLVPPNYVNGDDKGDSSVAGCRLDDDGILSRPGGGGVGKRLENVDERGENFSQCNNSKNNSHNLLNLGNERSNVNIPETQIPPLQATLPKTRPSTVIPSRYSSLPCSGPARSFDGGTQCGGIGPGGMRAAMGGGSFDGGGGRNILGIGISAVHDAVLRGGVAKLLPEPIVNEHPVTIYPGRASPPRNRVPPRTLPGSVERHREVCRNLNALDQLDSCNMADPCSKKLYSPSHQQFVLSKSPSSPVMIVQKPNKPGLLCHSNSSSSSTTTTTNNSSSSFSNNQSNPMIIDNKMLFGNLQIPPPRKRTNESNRTDSVSNHRMGDGRSEKRAAHPKGGSSESSDEEDFSDDSLEGQSLPPPPPPPIVPPPPSLSAPVTPSKRGSIAWEINLDDHLPPPPPAHLHQQLNHVTASSGSSSKKKKMTNKDKTSGHKLDTTSSSSSAKVIPRRRGRSVSGGSQSSLASTPSGGDVGCRGGSLSNNHSPKHHNLRHRSGSVEWPEPPDPPVCSTEDEAASLYSDSDDVIPTYPPNMTGQGTYVIRKGRRERHRLPELNASMSSSINSRLSSEGNSPAVSQLNSLFVPNSRHSIDLGASSQPMPPSITHHNSLLSPRSRLSLDLSSPNSTSELPQQSVIHASSSNNMMLGQQRYNDYKAFNNGPTSHYQQQQQQKHHQHDDILVGMGGNHHIESNGNGVVVQMALTHHGGSSSSLNNNHSNGANNGSSNSLSGPLARVSSLPAMGPGSQQMQQQQPQQSTQNDVITTTPRRELAPPIEEDEEQDSESQRAGGGAPLRQIENNISALLRGDISVARVGDVSHHHPRRPLAFRPGVHKSESAKEMLLSQAAVFGPLPPSPPSSSPEVEIDGFPPLPPSPLENAADDEDDAEDDIVRGMHGIRISSRTRLHFSRGDRENSLDHPPAVPPHRSTPSVNTLKTRSMDAGYTKKYASSPSAHSGGPGTLPSDMPPTASSRRRLMSGAYPKRSAQSPREERRLQTSASLPETPIFARGCDIPRTPHRRAPDLPTSGSRTAPRTNATTGPTLNSSIIGIGNTLGGGGGGRQHTITQALASGEMLRMAGGPARGWYPKQRHQQQRPASTEHLDRLHRTQGSMRAWEASGTIGTGGNRKPLTLPPNLTPKFFNKSPREALRRVTSLLIRKGNGKDKEVKREKDSYATSAVHRSPGSAGDIPVGQNGTAPANGTTNHHQKKKGFFKSFWKKSKHYSLEQ